MTMLRQGTDKKYCGAVLEGNMVVGIFMCECFVYSYLKILMSLAQYTQ